MRQIAVSGSRLLDPHRLTDYEWLSTNGLGGFASGTVAGINARRYHAILLAAPSVESRFVLVSQVQEEVATDTTWLLGAAYFPGVIHPQGFNHIFRFTTYPYPTWVYQAGGWVLEKQLTMIRGANATVISYHLVESPTPITLTLRPLMADRDYHHTSREEPERLICHHDRAWQRVQASSGVPDTLLAASGTFYPGGDWIRQVHYPIEEARGLDYIEDLYMPGEWKVTLEPGEQAWFVAWMHDEQRNLPDPEDLVDRAFSDVIVHQSQLLDQAGAPAGVAANLVVAADAYVIAHNHHTSVIAGYPWFTDWGRDAMISLPGLFLATGRAAEGKAVLTTFANAEKDGLIPNRFPDRSRSPEYNTVDAPLWFINACNHYVSYTNDMEGIAPLWPTIKAIIVAYRKGTRFGIGLGENGLIRAGEQGVQLTWMDAKVGDWVVTPRQGYPVEINALWYNALRCAAHLAKEIEPDYGETCRLWAAQVQHSFLSSFWSPDDGYLADLVDEDGQKDMSLRPNQIFAAGLPYPVVTGEVARSVVHHVWKHLVTPMGLRSLAPGDPLYHGVYRGNQYERDSAYHCGTVWAWLLGPFITAYRQAHGRTPHTQAVARSLIAPLLDQLWDAGLGHLSEVFDGDPPFLPGGCFAQAWSVAELLRLWVEEFDREPLEEASKGRQVYHGY